MKISFSMSFRDKERFFDRQAIINSVEPAFHSYLMQGGALVRKIAQRSIRRGGKKRKPSDPGKPPKHHLPGSNEGLRRIIYTLSSDKMSADIGPVKYERMKQPTIPRIHEFGAILSQPMNVARPTRTTRWMFEPANKEKYRGLHARLNQFARNPKKGIRLILHSKRGIPTHAYDSTDFRLVSINVQVRYRPRPFMAPALESPQTQKQLQAIWTKEIGKKIKQGIRWSKSRGR